MHSRAGSCRWPTGLIQLERASCRSPLSVWNRGADRSANQPTDRPTRPLHHSAGLGLLLISCHNAGWIPGAANPGRVDPDQPPAVDQDLSAAAAFAGRVRPGGKPSAIGHRPAPKPAQPLAFLPLSSPMLVMAFWSCSRFVTGLCSCCYRRPSRPVSGGCLRAGLRLRPRGEHGCDVAVAECVDNLVDAFLAGGVEAVQCGDLRGQPAQPGRVVLCPLDYRAIADAPLAGCLDSLLASGSVACGLSRR